MSRTTLVLSCLAATLIAGCGGGGSDDPAPAGGSGGSGSGGVGSGRLQADLTGKNASVYAETFLSSVSGEIASLDELVAVFGGDVPVLTLTNAEHTDPCTTSGSTTFTVAGNGANLTLQFNACVEDGVTSNGRMAVSFTNVNAATHSFDYRITYTGLALSVGSPTSALATSPIGERKSYAFAAPNAFATETLNGTTTIHTETTGGAHVHQLTVDTERTLSSPASTFTADDLTATVQHYPGDYYALRVTAAGGAVGWSGSGFANVAYRTATSDIRFSGTQASEMFVTLDGVNYGLRYKDAQGLDREVSMLAQYAGQLQVFDGQNDAPYIGSFPNLMLNSGTVQTLSLHDQVFDPDLEPVDIAVTVVNAPPGHTLMLTKRTPDRYDITAGDSGVFTVRVVVTDPAGAQASRDFTVTVNGDSDHDGLLDSYDPDDDNDGVYDTSDAFPFDATESHDADLDGIGDNADTDDDNDGVDDAHDAFPLDPACSSASNGTQCFLTALRGFDAVLVESGVLHFIKMGEKTVYRWSPDTNSFLTPWRLGTAVPSSSVMTSAAYVPAHNRFYFGYNSGAITSVSPLVGTEQAFASVPLAVRGLGSAGNFVVAQDGSGAWATHYVFASNGALRSSAEWNYYSRAYAFNPVERRLYFFRDDQSPDDLHYEEIDQTTGLRISAGETPYHGAYGIEPPIVVSPAGDLILIGSGNLFNAGALTWAGAVPGGIKAAQWDAADGLIQLRESTTGTSAVLERRDAALHVVEQRPFEGAPRAVVKVLQGYIVVTETQQRLFVQRYTPSNDTDGDGVSNTVDAFPLDVAASIDTDGDGYPDRWNGGKSQADSTTGLVLDAYPTESACYLPAHGDGVTCNIASTIPNYEPNIVVGDGSGIVYLLSADNNRIYRYSGPAAKHLSPIVVGNGTLLNRTAPSRMEYSPQHQRLYLGYPSGAVTYVNLNDPQLRERPFTNVATAVGGIGAAGEFVAVQDASGAWATHYYFDSNGTLKDSAEWNYVSRDYEWNPTLRRLFFFRDNMSPNDLHFEQVGLAGTIDSAGETPYHGSYGIGPPIVMSPDDQYVLIGSGNIFRASDLTWYRSLLSSFIAAVWDDNGNLTTVEDVSGTSRIYRYNASQQWQSEETRAGKPLALIEHTGGYLLVTYDGSKPTFSAVSR